METPAHNVDNNIDSMVIEPVLDLLIIGAGPVGLMAAIEAQRLGLSARIVERKEERSTHDSRALVVHPRVMELLQPHASVISKIQATKCKNEKIHVHFSRQQQLQAPLGGSAIDWGDTDFADLSFLPQYDTERFLEEELTNSGGAVEYGVELVELEQDNHGAKATLKHADGRSATVEAKYIIGCDGGRSTARELMGVDMHRGRSKVYFIVSDVGLVESPLGAHNEVHLFAHAEGVCIFFPLPESGRYRLIIQAPKGMTNKSQVDMDPAFFENLLQERTDLEFKVELHWKTVFEITHGVSETFRVGRVFLAGDASHVHSPVGGQGMNYGIADAQNLLWKLAWAKRCQADPQSIDFILDSYSDERHSMGSELVGVVEVATKLLATRNRLLQAFRNILMRFALKQDAGRRMRLIGELNLRYNPKKCQAILNPKGSGFVCQSGERLPNLRLHDGTHLHSLVDRTRHTWVFVNAPRDKVSSDTAIEMVPTVDGQVSRPVIPRASLQRSQVILVRPDLFVAGVDHTADRLRARLLAAGWDERVMAAM